MRRFRFPLAVLGTSLLIVLGIGVVGYLTVSSVLAQGFGPWGGHFGGPFDGHAIPPELQGLEQLPAERFKHFGGAQISLKDKDNNALTVNVTPGTVNAVSSTSLTLAANDGSTKTFMLDDKTVIRGKPDSTTPGNRPAATTLKQGDLVAVVTKNTDTTAKFVMSGGAEGFGPRGGHGPFGGPWGGRVGEPVPLAWIMGGLNDRRARGTPSDFGGGASVSPTRRATLLTDRPCPAYDNNHCSGYYFWRATMAVNLLQRVGLNKYEAEAYVALIADGPLTGYELGKRSNVPLSKSYEILERLSRRGLALVQPGDPPRYVAERPERFLAQTRADQETVLGALASALAGVRRADPADAFWVVRGRANVLARARALIDEAQSDVLIGLSGGDDALLQSIDGARARGCRVMVRHLDDPWREATGGSAPPELIVLLADDRESLGGTLSPDAHCQAVVTANPALALTVRGALGYWDAASPVRAVPVSEAADPGSERGTDWLDWEARKQQRLWRSQQGRRLA